MTMPTPDRFADAIDALAAWSATPPCPSLAARADLTSYLSRMAGHLRAIASADPRLAAFEGVTDPDGRPWLSLEPESGELELFTRAAAEKWSPDQAFTALSEMARRETWEVVGVEHFTTGLYERSAR
ncbi:hypothetical protein ABZ912_19885 [Nonomuraea angiospora]|uniref:hypothetical protein n=1 Tax=Nonomuraea angiospora TaxID=46172 RepID=UPI0033C148AB